MKTRTILLSLLLMLVVLPLSAQPPGGREGGQGGPPAMTIDAAMAEKLELSIEQMSLVEQMQNENELAKTMITENEELSDDEKREMMMSIMEAQMEAYKEILTEDQYEKFEELLKEKRPSRGEGGGGRGGDGQRPPRGGGGGGGGGGW